MVPVIGNVRDLLCIDVLVGVWSAAAPGTTEQQITVNGVRLATDKVVGWSAPIRQTDIITYNVYVKADNVLAVNFLNVNAGNVTPLAGQTYTFTIARREQAQTDAVS
jgi:hypothetical protein